MDPAEIGEVIGGDRVHQVAHIRVMLTGGHLRPTRL
jgi:hypothetical protein